VGDSTNYSCNFAHSIVKVQSLGRKKETHTDNPFDPFG